MTTPNVVIIVARCSQSKEIFGIRMEEKLPGQWISDWAFRLKEQTARKEGYHQTKITGSFNVDSAYPGCPYCENRGFFKCGCGHIACWNGHKNPVTCPWCNETIELGGMVTELTAGEDR